MPFAGFIKTTLLEAGDLPLADLARMAMNEGQSTRPIYRVHRWFARRLGSQFRAILTALSLSPEEEGCFWSRYNDHIPLDDALVVDTFVGGGTTLVEASRCGARVIGYDIDPVAAGITRFELAARARGADWEAARPLVKRLSAQGRHLHRAVLEDGTAVDVLHHFWVEVTTCRHCSVEFELHPHYLLAWDKAKKLQWGFCKHCHEVQTLPLHRERLDCACGRRTVLASGTLDNGTVRCPCCRKSWKLAEGNDAHPPVYRLFAQEVLLPAERGFVRTFRKATDADHATYRAAEQALEDLEAQGLALAPQRLIPEAPRFDRRPIIHGIRRYAELFNARQRLHLSRLGRAIMAIEDEDVRRLLAMAFSEHLAANCMYTGYAFGYRRTSPLFSIHGFRHVVRPVEINPWLDGTGRGTFVNAYRKIGRAIEYASRPTDLERPRGDDRSPEPIGPPDGVVSCDPAEVVDGRARAAVAAQSSEDLAAIPDGAVHLVLTDPPYFDNINYSELSDFYLAWHQVLGVAEGEYRDPARSAPLAENLAATERSEEAVAAYTDTLTKIFSSCHRVLHDHGVCVFTYHHKFARAWLAVATALVHAGLRCTQVLPMRGEGQGGLHSKEGTIKWDAVMVCRKREQPRTQGILVLSEKEITAAREQADWYGEKLGAVKGGFGKPDRLNFTLACLAAAARMGMPGGEYVPLSGAMQSITQEYEKAHAKAGKKRHRAHGEVRL